MKAKEYNWKTMSEKDVFVMKLEGGTPHFGYISQSLQAPFVQFLITNGFLEFKSNFQDLVDMANAAAADAGENNRPIKNNDNFVNLYVTTRSFSYETLSGSGSPYRSTKSTVKEGHKILTSRANRLLDVGSTEGSMI